MPTIAANRNRKFLKKKAHNKSEPDKFRFVPRGDDESCLEGDKICLELGDNMVIYSLDSFRLRFKRLLSEMAFVPFRFDCFLTATKPPRIEFLYKEGLPSRECKKTQNTTNAMSSHAGTVMSIPHDVVSNVVSLTIRKSSGRVGINHVTCELSHENLLFFTFPFHFRGND